MTDVSINCSEFACSGGIICRWNALSNRAEDLCGPMRLRGELVTSHLCLFFSRQLRTRPIALRIRFFHPLCTGVVECLQLRLMRLC